ncbi:MAG: DeoR/GlpR transcriptional regulator [Pirellulales bacterium]|nr:DeoR/GlpR transcriptional regulator [Pirellulales bacterium]
MNPSERQSAIVEYLGAVGVCMYQDLAKRLGVSEMTVRRDVDKLFNSGDVIKILGGVQTAKASENLYESPVKERLPIRRLEKERIACEAAKQIEPRQTIFLDGGTTSIVLAQHLAEKFEGLTVVTHSAIVCMEFGRELGGKNTVFTLGGQFDPASACFVGPTAEESARRFFVDIAFFSTKGFLPDEGTFESSIGTIRVKQIIAEQAARSILLVDQSKFGQRALCKALDIKQIDKVISDQPENCSAAETSANATRTY